MARESVPDVRPWKRLFDDSPNERAKEYKIFFDLYNFAVEEYGEKAVNDYLKQQCDVEAEIIIRTWKGCPQRNLSSKIKRSLIAALRNPGLKDLQLRRLRPPLKPPSQR